MSRLWTFAPALVGFTGALLVAVGTIWASFRQSNFNAEIRDKNEEITRLQRESADAIIGGDSFCYMGLMIPDATALIARPMFVHHGRYPLYDVTARIVDVEEIKRLKALKDPALMTALMGTTVGIGNLTPGFSSGSAVTLQRHSPGRDFSYNVFYVARNGAWTQFLRMRWTGSGWATAEKVVGLSEGKELYSNVTPDYPRRPNGDVDWDEKAEPAPATTK
jgi:hypothetical protein